MNVLYVIRGNETYISQQAKIEQIALLRNLGVNPFLIGEVSEEVLLQLKKMDLPFMSLFATKKIDKTYAKKFKQYILDKKIDIVHYLDGRDSRSGLFALKKLNVKVISYYGSLSLHWYDPTSYLTYLNPRVDKIICNSQHVYDHVKKQLFGKNKQKAIKIYKGYNPDWFSDVSPFDYATLNIPKDAIKVCFVGNHRKVKGTQYFLSSSYHLHSEKEIHYIVIGERTNEGNLAEIAKNSPIAKNIHFLGKRTDVVSLLKSADIYSQTSLSEGFGRAISEAMCVEKPIVMTNAGGCTELIDDETGIITPLKDAKAIGKAISKLANNDEMRIKMGQQAKKRIENVYHINTTVKDTLKLYQEALKN